jgi:Cu/Zn superoxide dismutase
MPIFCKTAHISGGTHATRGRLCKNFRATHRSDSRGDTLRRITKAALGGVASCALILGGTQAANGLSAVEEYNYSGALADLQPLSGGPLDGASATLRIKETPLEGTLYKLRVSEINPSAKDKVFGAHLHTGPCVEGLGALAGPHYNAGGGISPLTEVWFDVVSNANGEATFDASAPFVPVDSLATDLITQTPGVMSVVIHVAPTNPADGMAGARQACLPVLVPQWNTPTS